MFITFEGIEGSGKSTQIQKCCDLLASKNIPFILTKEPGGTEYGKTIRQWLLDPSTSFHHHYTEVLLFIADRLEHVESIIKPALNDNKVVLCDRFKDSTFAYQLHGRQLDSSVISMLNSLTLLEPDLTILFDCDIKTGLQRAKDRAKLDRFEDEHYDFHQRIYDAYHQLAKTYSQRFRIVDANGTIEDVYQKTLTILADYIKDIS